MMLGGSLYKHTYVLYCIVHTAHSLYRVGMNITLYPFTTESQHVKVKFKLYVVFLFVDITLARTVIWKTYHLVEFDEPKRTLLGDLGDTKR